LADAELIRYFGGSYPMQIVFEAADEDAWNDPTKLRAVAGLQQLIEAAEHTGKTRSIADYVKRMHQALHPDDPGFHVLPEDQALVTQYLFLYSLSGAPDDFEDVVDYDYRKACTHALVRADHSPLLKRVIADIDSYAAEHIAPLGITTTVTGNAKIAYVFIDLITTGQVRSLLVALVLVALLTGLLCRAPAAGAFAVTPVAVAIALNFGALGWFGIPLGPTTAMISSIGIGIGVDYAIHFLIKYQRVRRAGLTPEAAMHETLGTAGVAIFYNAVVVFAGFLVLVGSQFPPNRVFGLLVAMNMVVCFLGSVTLMAALLHRVQPAFVRPPDRRASPSKEGTAL
jgi:predicted RND superfamily exporter protein